MHITRSETRQESCRDTGWDVWRDRWQDFSRQKVSPRVSDRIICMTLSETLSETRFSCVGRRLFFGTNCLARNRRGKPWTKISRLSMKQIPLKCGKRVSDSSRAVIYLFFRLCRNGHIPWVQCKRDTACFESMPSAYAADFFYYSLSFSLLLSRCASKAKIVSHLSMLL